MKLIFSSKPLRPWRASRDPSRNRAFRGCRAEGAKHAKKVRRDGFDKTRREIKLRLTFKDLSTAFWLPGCLPTNILGEVYESRSPVTGTTRYCVRTTRGPSFASHSRSSRRIYSVHCSNRAADFRAAIRGRRGTDVGVEGVFIVCFRVVQKGMDKIIVPAREVPPFTPPFAPGFERKCRLTPTARLGVGHSHIAVWQKERERIYAFFDQHLKSQPPTNSKPGQSHRSNQK